MLLVKQHHHSLNRGSEGQTVALPFTLSIQKIIFIIQKNTWLYFTQDIKHFFTYFNYCKEVSLKPWTLYKWLLIGNMMESLQLESVLQSRLAGLAMARSPDRGNSCRPSYWSTCFQGGGIRWSNTLEGNRLNDPNSKHMSKFPFQKKKNVENGSDVSLHQIKSHTQSARIQPASWFS